MRSVAMGVLVVTLAWGQSSVPTYWRFAPASPALLVGADWRQVSQSNLAGLPGGLGANLGFVDEMTNLLVAAEPGAGEPRFLATAAGRFNLTKLRHMAAGEGARTGRYRGVELLSAGGAEVAVVDERTILVGDARSVRAAIDRGGAVAPREGALWRRAAELSKTYSVWAAMPSVQAFQPAGARSPLSDLRSFEGGIALQRGLALGFDLVMSSEESAGALEALLRASPSPALRDFTVRRQGERISLSAFVDSTRMQAGLKTMLAAGEISRANLMDWIVASASPAVTAPQVAAAPAPPARKRVIRIVGLEEGTREIAFPPPSN